MSLSGSDLLLARGEALQRQGQLAEAAAVFRQVLAREPRNPRALHLLGTTLGRMGRAQEAVPLLEAAVGIQPSNPYLRVNLGKALADAGRDADALRAYARAAALKPDFAPAHRGRGQAHLRLGQAQEALTSFQHALRVAPEDAQAHNDAGVALERLGRHGEAIGHFERAVSLNPYYAVAHLNRGAAEMSAGRYAAALESFERALSLEPRSAVILANCGSALRALGRAAEAVGSYDSALALAAGDAGVHHGRALALLMLERHAEALASLERAVELDPRHFGAHFHRGVALALLGRYEEALASFDQALAVNDLSAEAHDNRGVALGHLGRHEEALASFARAMACRPEYVDAYNNAGSTLKSLGRHHEALETFDKGLAIAPDHAPTLWGKALLELAAGRLESGWRLHEARLRLEHLRGYHRELPMPRWSGENLEGRSILVHAEQGLGDTLQFCRYVPLLEARGARVTFEVPEPLGKLMRSLAIEGALIHRGEPLPPTDFQCPLLSLPLAFDTRLDSIPGGVPYLSAEAAAAASWRERLRALPGLRIGLNWQGHAGAETQTWIRGRSFALACAEPLSRLSGVSLVSLQKGAAAGQRHQVEFGGAVAELTDPSETGPDAMMETDALVSALDLVITSDTAVAHLAGALGVPVWVVLHSDPDWRWLLERSDSPWYPTMRLFRQRSRGDWLEVFERVAEEVRRLIR